MAVQGSHVWHQWTSHPNFILVINGSCGRKRNTSPDMTMYRLKSATFSYPIPIGPQTVYSMMFIAATVLGYLSVKLPVKFSKLCDHNTPTLHTGVQTCDGKTALH